MATTAAVPRRISALILAFAVFTPAYSAAQENATGTRIRADAAEITLSGRVQLQVNTSSADGVAPTEMLLRRVRFGANVRINDVVSGRVQPEFAGQSVGLADAYLQLALSPGFQLRAGREHRHFTVMEWTSSTQIIPIERGLRIRGVADHDLSSLLTALRYTDRDVGVQLRGTPAGLPLGFSYVIGLLAGPLQGSSGEEGTFQLVARTSVEPVERTRIGIGMSRRDFARSAIAPVELAAGTAWSFDAEYGGTTPAPGAHMVGQIAVGDVNPFTVQRFSGGQVWAAYRIALGERVTIVEPLLRISHASIDAPPEQRPLGGTLFTPGANIYFGGLNRMLLNLDVWSPSADRATTEMSFRTQFQMVF